MRSPTQSTVWLIIACDRASKSNIGTRYLLRRQLTSPLPLAGSRRAKLALRSTRSAAHLRARARRGGGKPLPSTSASCGNPPTPTLPRKRERELAAVAFADQSNLILL